MPTNPKGIADDLWWELHLGVRAKLYNALRPHGAPVIVPPGSSLRLPPAELNRPDERG